MKFTYNFHIVIRYIFFLRYKFTIKLEFPLFPTFLAIEHTFYTNKEIGDKLCEIFLYLETWSHLNDKT